MKANERVSKEKKGGAFFNLTSSTGGENEILNHRPVRRQTGRAESRGVEKKATPGRIVSREHTGLRRRMVKFVDDCRRFLLKQVQSSTERGHGEPGGTLGGPFLFGNRKSREQETRRICHQEAHRPFDSGTITAMCGKR